MINKKHSIYFLVRSYQSFEYFDSCVDSILSQENTDFKIIFVDDASDYTENKKKYIRNKLIKHIVLFNKKRRYSLYNAYHAIHKFVPDDAIIINVDGDDALIGNDVVDKILNIYKKTGCDLTYGNCRYFCPGEGNHGKDATSVNKMVNSRFPKEIETKKQYRKYHFLPLHLRTWKSNLFKRIPKDQFLRKNKEWIQFCEDQAMYYPMLELCNKNYYVVKEILYQYNISNPSNDNKIHQSGRLFDELTIRKKHAL
jgi:glycosyltransferase involved in cell wall biosynthesis